MPLWGWIVVYAVVGFVIGSLVVRHEGIEEGDTDEPNVFGVFDAIFGLLLVTLVWPVVLVLAVVGRALTLWVRWLTE